MRTNTGILSAEFLGDAGPGGAAKDGNITFYKDFEVQGTSTVNNLTVSGTLLVGTTNVLSTLNLKANASDVYTKAQIAGSFQPKIDSFTAPLQFTENIY